MKPVKPCKQCAVLVARDTPVQEASKHDMTVQSLVNILSGTAECIARAWMVAVCRADWTISLLADGVILSTCGLFVGVGPSRYVLDFMTIRSRWVHLSFQSVLYTNHFARKNNFLAFLL
jgi:hypothetical protein